MKKKKAMEELLTEEIAPLAEIVSFSHNLLISAYTDSTVVKSPEAVYRGLALSKTRFISEEYLLNFQRSDQDWGKLVGINNYSLPMVLGALTQRKLTEDASELIPLPTYKNVRSPIGAVIRSRRSIREFSGVSLSLRDFATLLFYAQGVSGQLSLENVAQTESLGKSDRISLRTAPSGGGLYPIDLYIISLNIKKLARGIYKYSPEHHALRRISKLAENFNLSEIAQFGEIEADKANFLIVYVYKLLDNSRKYGDAGMAYAFIEAGQISENLHLVCTALGLGSCDVGGFRKHELEKRTNVDGISQHAILLTVVGK